MWFYTCSQGLVTDAKLKSKCSMDEKQCHDSATQNTMNIPQPRIILHMRITIRGQVVGKGRLSIDLSLPQKVKAEEFVQSRVQGR